MFAIQISRVCNSDITCLSNLSHQIWFEIMLCFEDIIKWLQFCISEIRHWDSRICELNSKLTLRHSCSMRSSSRSFQNSILMFTMSRHRFHHNSMRAQSILDIIEWLNRFYLKLQNESSFVCFEDWMQMLFNCKIEQFAKHRNLIKFNSNS